MNLSVICISRRARLAWRVQLGKYMLYFQHGRLVFGFTGRVCRVVFCDVET